MTAVKELTLSNLVRQIVADNPAEPSARELAKLVAEATPKSRILDFYADALTQKVREVIGMGRNEFNTVPVRSGKGVKSGRMTDISDNNSWTRKLAERLGIPEKGYIPFGECTAADLRAYAKSIRAHADAIYSSADYYDRAADAVEVQGVEKVRDLKGEVQ